MVIKLLLLFRSPLGYFKHTRENIVREYALSRKSAVFSFLLGKNHFLVKEKVEVLKKFFKYQLRVIKKQFALIKSHEDVWGKIKIPSFHWLEHFEPCDWLALVPGVKSQFGSFN